MAFIKQSTLVEIKGDIPVYEQWIGKPIMVHTAALDIARDNTHADNHERYHVLSLGWDWVGYGFLIEKDGTIYHSAPTMGKQYHCVGGGQNHKSFGVCICGHGSKDPLTPEQHASLIKIIKAFRTGTMLVHRDFPHKGKRKSCPGDVLLADLTNKFPNMMTRVG